MVTFAHHPTIIKVLLRMERAARSKQRPRNRDNERRGRRYNRQQRLARSARLPADVRDTLLLKGLARPATSVRGQLLSAILTGAALDPDGRWIFDGSVRDLAAGGLEDGKHRDNRYLFECMQAFIDAGILEKLYGGKGRPVVYAVRA